MSDLQKRLEGVLPSPPAPGVGGIQPATEGSPAQVTGTEPAATSVPSVVPEVQPQGDTVPLGLHKRISDKLIRKEQELEGAEAELQRLRSAGGPPPADANLRPGYADQIDALTREAESVIETDPIRALRLERQASDLRSQSAANNAIEGMMTEMQEAKTQAQWDAEAQDATKRAIDTYPELGDPNSAFYRDVDRRFTADNYLQKDPAGILRAAREADLARRSHPAAPASFEGSGVGAPVAATPPKADPSERLRDIKFAMRQGNMAPWEQALGANFMDILSDKAPKLKPQ